MDDLANILNVCLENGGTHHWEKFIGLAQPIVAAAVVRTLARWNCDRRQLADDLIQDTFLKLCSNDFRILRSFRSKETNALCAYLRTVVNSVVTDHLNSSSTQKQGSGRSPISLDHPDANAVAADHRSVRDIERNLMLNRVTQCLSKHADRDRRIFWLYHRHGFTPEDIAASPGISLGKGGVETILYRLTKTIGECVKSGGNFRTAAEGVLP